MITDGMGPSYWLIRCNIRTNTITFSVWLSTIQESLADKIHTRQRYVYTHPPVMIMDLIFSMIVLFFRLQSPFPVWLPFNWVC